MLRWWADMKPGEKRSFDLESVRTKADGSSARQLVKADGHVAGIETVRTPAGEFRAWRIDYRGNTRNEPGPGYGTFRLTVWYAPELRNYVAMESERHWDGKLESITREELTSLQFAGNRL